MTEGPSNIDELCINTIRTLSMHAIQKANSGHPGAPMGLAPAAYVLWTRVLKHHPKSPNWFDRDRFVLSGGHASMLLYSLLHLSGYGLSMDDLKKFRQWGSRTPGHPEYHHTVGVETTTGPLGQGFANAVGMAMAERHLAAVFNQPEHPVVDHYTYVMCGDGDLMEGITAESASLAGHLGLSRLVCLYDDNRISIEGSTQIAFTEDVALRFQAYNWNVLKVEDGNDLDAIETALNTARDDHNGRPTLVMLHTHIAYGSPNKQDTADAHGAPLGDEEVRLTKKNLGWPEDKTFYVPEAVKNHFDQCRSTCEQKLTHWQEIFNAYQQAFPELARKWRDTMSPELPSDWDRDLPSFLPNDAPIATRAASGKVLNALAARIPNLMGGSADLAPSNKTLLEESHEFQKNHYDGRNIRFGVREHAMAGILSGLYLHSGIRPYGGTFLVFADYMRPAIRVACLMQLPVIYVFTHDSIAVGEDGPTHQPIEQLASLRAIPHLTVIRPADASETAQAWRQALRTQTGPVALILSRQKLPVIDSREARGDLANGAYILVNPARRPDIILIASGSEVHLALNAAEKLAERDIAVRVVSMPSWELFEQSSQWYKDSVLPPDIGRRLAIEAGSPMGWEKYVGHEGETIGMTTFGASAPGATVMEKFGFTTADIVKKALEMCRR
jgi:transketolase